MAPRFNDWFAEALAYLDRRSQSGQAARLEGSESFREAAKRGFWDGLDPATFVEDYLAGTADYRFDEAPVFDPEKTIQMKPEPGTEELPIIDPGEPLPDQPTPEELAQFQNIDWEQYQDMDGQPGTGGVELPLPKKRGFLGRVFGKKNPGTLLGPKEAAEEFKGGHVNDVGEETDEGLSQNGSEGLGGHGDGFEIQGQGVTRRAPGEAPKADGGRPQSQEMDSYDQPQYVEGLEDEPAFYESWNGLKDPEGFENQEHRGLTSGGTDITDERLDERSPGWRKLDGEWVPGMFDEGVSLREMFEAEDRELKKSSEKEKREHPWASEKQATQIARDHMGLGEQSMATLKEFFVLNEGRSVYYTLEPEANGMGRLLQWEEVKYAGSPEAEEAEDDVSYEVIARGDVEQLLAKLAQAEPGAAEVADEIRQSWDEAIDAGGEAVWFGVEAGKPRVDIQLKVGQGDVESDGDPWDQYSKDNPDRYF